MKTMRVVSVAGAVLVWAAGIFFDSTFISQAQMQMPPVQAQPDSVVQVMADAEGLQLVPLDQLPKAGTVWTVGSGQSLAPLPYPPSNPNSMVYALGPAGVFLVDNSDSQLDLAPQRLGRGAMSAAAVVTAQANTLLNLIAQVQGVQMNAELDALFPLDGNGTNSGDSFSSDFQFQTFTSNDLWLQIKMTNSTAYLVINPPWSTSNGVYDLFFATNIASPSQWSWMARSAPGQTNFTLASLPFPSGFFILGTSADTDGDGLTDAYENFVSKTDPTLWDSDGDGVSDGDELSPNGLPWRFEQARLSSAVIYANSPITMEGGSCGLCTVYLPAPAPLGGATVQYRLGGPAVLNTDFTISPSSSTLTIPGGYSSGTISICAINDTVYSDMDRYVIVTLTNSTSCSVDGHPAQVNIIDNDPPGIRVYALPPWIRRPSPTFGTNTAGFYFVRDGASTNTLTVSLSTSGSTAVAGADYPALPSSVIFPANIRTNWLPLTIIPSTNASDKTLVLTMTSAPGYQIDPTNGAATMTISSTALPVLPVVQVVATVADATGSMPGQFAFSRFGSTTETLRVNYHTVGDTVIGTTNGQDITSYSALPGYVDIQSGATNATVSVIPNTPSSIVQTVTVVLAAGEYSIGANNTATVYIDGAGPLNIIATVVKDGIYGVYSQPAEIQIIRYGSALAPRYMTWSITNQYTGTQLSSASMSGDVDTAPLPGGPGSHIYWKARQSIANVNLTTTWTSAPDNWVLPTLFLSTNGYLTVPFNPPSAMFSITSSGSPAAIVQEGNTVPNAITVTRLHPNANPITLYLAVGGSAVNNTDFSMSTAIGFSAYQSTINVPVQAFSNSLTNGWKTAVVTMSSGGFSSQVGQSGHDLAYVRIQDAQAGNPVYDTDIDGDGIPDGYELSHLADGYDPTTPDNAYVDDDRDGLGLIEELQLGTDPSVPDAPPVHPSLDDSDYVPLKLHLGAVGKLVNTTTSCGACHAVTLRAGTHISTSPRSNWTNNPALADYVIQFLRGTNYPVQITSDPYTFVLPTGLTTNVSPHYTGAYIAQFLTGTNGLYPFIVDTNRLLGTNLPMVLEALSKSAMLYVPDMLIAADVDRDGVVNFADRDDRTATNSPFVFWINDDADSGSDDAAQDLDPSPSANNPINSFTPAIDDLRDLEDFARLQFKIAALPQQFLTNGNYQVRVYLTNLVGAPSLRLFHAAEANGGLGYLTNTVTANSQVTASALGVLASGTPVTLSSTNWATLSSNSFLLPMIFEGIATGRCVITFGFSSNSGPAVALSRPFYLDLKHVTDLYEHWTVGDDIITDWYQIPPKAARTADSAVFGNPQKQEDLDYILFVHGWRMQPWERRAFASTAYKRLWHLGYKGRFGLYSWPTDWTSTSPWDMTTQYNRQNYDRSEQRAWNASWGLWRLLMDLNTRQSGRVRMIAHSMGNITASEALRFRGLNPNKPPLVQGYIASQAASVAFAYDAVHPEDVGTFGIFTPEVYAEFPRGNATNVYFTGMKNAVQRDQNLNPRIINFHNKQDYALNSTFAWPANQLFKPDVNYSYHIFEGTWWRNLMVHTELFLTTDQWEIFAHIAQARSKALGCSEDPSHQVRGEIGGSVDLNATPFNYGKNDYEHSAEFNSINMNRRSYWWQVLSTFSLTNTLPNP